MLYFILINKKFKTTSTANTQWNFKRNDISATVPIKEEEDPNDLKQWARKDLTEQFKLAEKFLNVNFVQEVIACKNAISEY